MKKIFKVLIGVCNDYMARLETVINEARAKQRDTEMKKAAGEFVGGSEFSEYTRHGRDILAVETELAEWAKLRNDLLERLAASTT